jgi:hypothetical protein
MCLSFAYLAFSAVLKLLLRRRCSEFAKDVELLVLRHQLVVLGRQERLEGRVACVNPAGARHRVLASPSRHGPRPAAPCAAAVLSSPRRRRFWYR